MTDSVGFLLLVPAVRKLLADYLIQKGMLSAVNGFEKNQFSEFFNGGFESVRTGEVYDASSEEDKSQSNGTDLEKEPLHTEQIQLPTHEIDNSVPVEESTPSINNSDSVKE